MRTLLIATAIALCSCGSCDKQETPPPVPVVAEAPVPLPSNVIAELTFTTPDETWTSVQAGLGGAAILAPQTVGALFISGDPTTAEKVDTKLPLFGLVVGNNGDHRVVWCAHARANSLSSIKSGLTDSDTAKFKAAGVEGLIDVLEPKGTGKRVIGLAHGDFVLFASSRADLAAFGPYAYRTLPTKPLPKSAVTASLGHDALAGAVHDWITEESASAHAQLTSFDDELRKDHGGRAPDFGDPRALIDVLDRWSKAANLAVSDMDHAMITVDVDATGLRANVTLSPPKGEGAAHTLVTTMRPGDASPLLDAPAGMILEALVRSDVDERAANATGVAETLRAVADKKLPAADDKRLTAALDTFAKTRGDYFMLTVGTKPSARGVAVTTHVADDTKAADAVGVLVDEVTRPPFYDALRAALSISKNKTAPKDLGVFGQGKLLTLELTSQDLIGPTLQIAYASKAGLLGVAASNDAPALLGMVSAPEHKLAEDARAKDAIDRLGRDCTLALVVAPGMLNASGTDPVVVGWGRRGDDAFLSLDTGSTAARQLLMLLAAAVK